MSPSWDEVRAKGGAEFDLDRLRGFEAVIEVEALGEPNLGKELGVYGVRGSSMMVEDRDLRMERMVEVELNSEQFQGGAVGNCRDRGV